MDLSVVPHDQEAELELYLTQVCPTPELLQHCVMLPPTGSAKTVCILDTLARTP